MIDINLIPAALRKNGNGNADSVAINIPQEILLGVGVTLVFFILIIHLTLGLVWWQGTNHLSSYKENWQKVLPDKNSMDAMNKETKDLKKKIAMLSDITAKASMRWSPKFNIISDDLPRGLWIRKMVLDKAGLTIEGSVVSRNQNEINDVGAFISGLKQNNDFMKDFSLVEENSIQRSKNNAVEVTDFTVMAKLK